MRREVPLATRGSGTVAAKVELAARTPYTITAPVLSRTLGLMHERTSIRYAMKGSVSRSVPPCGLAIKWLWMRLKWRIIYCMSSTPHGFSIVFDPLSVVAC